MAKAQYAIAGGDDVRIDRIELLNRQTAMMRISRNIPSASSSGSQPYQLPYFCMQGNKTARNFASGCGDTKMKRSVLRLFARAMVVLGSIAFFAWTMLAQAQSADDGFKPGVGASADASPGANGKILAGGIFTMIGGVREQFIQPARKHAVAESQRRDFRERVRVGEAMKS